MSQWIDDNNGLAGEQHGFRKGRSTVDQIASLTNIIDVRKTLRKSAFCAFIDFKKAYDTIDRNLLWRKLTSLGVDTEMCLAIKSLYNGVACSVRLNSFNTDCFSVNCGLKQGFPLSLLLFNIFINELTVYLKSFDLGIDIGGEKACILLYADGIALLDNTENDLYYKF